MSLVLVGVRGNEAGAKVLEDQVGLGGEQLSLGLGGKEGSLTQQQGWEGE